MKNSVKFSPLNSIDNDFLYEMYNNPSIYKTGYFEFTYPVNDIQIKGKLDKFLSNKKQKHFLIHYESERAGLAQIYNISLTNRKCNIGILLLPEFSQKGIGAKTLDFLIGICFMDINLHKIEVLVSQSNEASIKLCEKTGFMREGVLKDSIFKQGKYEDLYCYGLINSKK